MSATAMMRSAQPRVARILLALGIAAGPLYIVLAVAQMLMREGFDMRRHAVSLLSNGDLGWIQILSFLLSGVLVAAGATGCRQALRGAAVGPGRRFSSGYSASA